MDADRADVARLLHVWDTYSARRAWQNAVDVHTTAGNDEYTAGAHRSLDELPEVTALDALRANAQLVELLTGRRWHVMRDAREEGASWSQIGEALGMSKQGAQDYYRRRTAEQEQHAPDFDDRSRSLTVEGDAAAAGPQHDEYYRQAAPPYADPQHGDFVLVMLDAFRGPDGEFAAADVVTVDTARPNEVEVEQPERLGGGGRAWVQLKDVALISPADR